MGLPIYSADGFCLDGFYQCGSCDEFFEEPTPMGNCPNCGSGNWVRGCIDEPEPIENSD
jgi:rRNA maturation endonuclease Nob1